ncbi:hypothetical protein [Mucilaginibacter sp. HD30]
MFTAYLKYISLLLFSGLILTFYRATLPSSGISPATLKALKPFKTGQQQQYFSVLKDVILPLFPALNKGDLLQGNKK